MTQSAKSVDGVLAPASAELLGCLPLTTQLPLSSHLTMGAAFALGAPVQSLAKSVAGPRQLRHRRAGVQPRHARPRGRAVVRAIAEGGVEVMLDAPDARPATAILLVDHGSKRAQANEMLLEIADMTRAKSAGVPVHTAHMEIAEPSIADGMRACVDGGATHVVLVPFFLSPGRHATTDIPEIAAEAAALFPGVSYEVRPPIGTHPGVVDIILDRAGL